MTKRTYRLIYGTLLLALLAVIGIAVVYGSPEGDDIGLPAQIERITPVPHETVLRQARVEVDMPVGYELEMWIDGFRIPDNEVFYVPGTGVHSWGPGVDRTFLEWARGEHTVRIKWNTVNGLPDVGEYEWTFRAF